MTIINKLILLEKHRQEILDKQIKNIKNKIQSFNKEKRDWDNNRLDITKKLFVYYTNKCKLSTKWKLKFDNASNRCAETSYNTNSISISKLYINSIDRTKKELVNTILHEIAHALCPGDKHNKIWQQKAIEIGCDGKIYNSISSFAKPVWILQCKKTCCYYPRQRRSNIDSLYCVKCNDDLYFTKVK
jgi:hypothetical protein